ncbi:MAG: 1-acyl-sn-glycerol-3-phosphate acyltransferase [Lysobacterales bacterium]
MSKGDWVDQVVPPALPRTHGALARWLGRTVLALGGWKVTGRFADIDKAILIVAPHSSWWDGIWGMAAKLAMGLRVEIMAKHELFNPLLAPLLRALGAVPIDRGNAHGVVPAMAARFRNAEQLWLVIAPEGTRRRVEHWKSGFWHIARAAEVPVVCVYFHYPERLIGIGPALTMTGDLAGDMARVREFYRPWRGKTRSTL